MKKLLTTTLAVLLLSAPAALARDNHDGWSQNERSDKKDRRGRHHHGHHKGGHNHGPSTPDPIDPPAPRNEPAPRGEIADHDAACLTLKNGLTVRVHCPRAPGTIADSVFNLWGAFE